jgi:hypothetical protein
MKTKNKIIDDSSKIDPKKLKRMARGAFLAQAAETAPKNSKLRISVVVQLLPLEVSLAYS